MTTRSHKWIDRRSLAMDERIAEKIASSPELLDRARNNLDRWIEQRQPEPPAVMLEWKRILCESSLDEILDLLRRDDAEARRLRQSSPFCGILTSDERMEILRKHEASRT